MQQQQQQQAPLSAPRAQQKQQPVDDDICESPMFILATKTIESPCIGSASTTASSSASFTSSASGATQTPSRRQLFDSTPNNNQNDAFNSESPPRPTAGENAATTTTTTTTMATIFPPFSAAKLNLDSVESTAPATKTAGGDLAPPPPPRMELLMQVAASDGKQKKKRQAPNPEKKSAYRGVSWQKTSKAWVGQYKSNGKTTYLGLFANEVEAAKAYDLAVYVKGGAQNGNTQATNNQFNFGVPSPEEVATFKGNNNIPAGRLGASLSKRADMERRTDMRLVRQSSTGSVVEVPVPVETIAAAAVPLAPALLAEQHKTQSDDENSSNIQDDDEDLNEDDVTSEPKKQLSGTSSEVMAQPPPPPPKPATIVQRQSTVAAAAAVDTKSERGATSHYRGVSWYAARQIWKASIQVNRKKEYIGRFNTEEEAARAYNRRAFELRGREAILNQVPDTHTRYPNGEEPSPTVLPTAAAEPKPARRASVKPKRASVGTATAAASALIDAISTTSAAPTAKRAKVVQQEQPLPIMAAVPTPTHQTFFGTPRANKSKSYHDTPSQTFNSATMDDEFFTFASPMPSSMHHQQLPASSLQMNTRSRSTAHNASFTPLMVLDSPASSNKVVPFAFTPSGLGGDNVRKMTPFS